MPRIITWQVTGMTCRSCEKLIGDSLKDVPGVIETEVSVRHSKASIRLQDGASDPDLVTLNRELASLGYVLYPAGCAIPSTRAPFSKRFGRALLALFVVGLIGTFILTPLGKLLPAASTTASVGALILLGIVASVSTCLATTGGFMLAYSAEASSRRKTILMHLGRLTAFVLGGALLGAIGGALPTGSSLWYGALAIILGIGFLAVALNLLELSPSFAQMGLSLPPSTQRFADRLRRRPGGVTPFLVGAVTFILPCGFTQTAQALALASGSPTRGALLLLAFSLGTLPVLLGVTFFATAATFKHKLLRTAVGAVMFFFAFGQIQAGLAIFGIAPQLATAPSTIPMSVASANNIQIIKMDVTASGYSPNSITIVKGVPVRWEVNRADMVGCANSIVSRQLGISQPLSAGLNVITFTPQTSGLVTFSCPMGMVRGSFNVVDRTNS